MSFLTSLHQSVSLSLLYYENSDSRAGERGASCLLLDVLLKKTYFTYTGNLELNLWEQVRKFCTFILTVVFL